MRVKYLKINNLRVIREAEFEADPHINLFTGANGAGKTSVLEALVVLAKGKSFRAGSAGALIGEDNDVLRVVARVVDHDREHRLGLERDNGSWQGRIDGQDVSQLSEFSRHVPFVLFEPNTHQLVSGSPDIRRKYIDWGVFHVKHEHLPTWRAYARVLKQRNAALKQRQRDVVASLDAQAARYGEQLNNARRDVLDQLEENLHDLLDAFSPGFPETTLQFRKGWAEDSLAESLSRALDRDLELGLTTVGPHRADLHLRCEDQPARERLSRGEQKILAVALQLTQARVIIARGRHPLILLDDIASEFDATHLRRVLATARSCNCQLWVTGTDSGVLLAATGSEGTVFHVEHGALSTLRERSKNA